MSYLLIKWVHILSATILFGAGIGSAFHVFVAIRRGQVAGIYSALQTVVLADFVLTSPAVIVQLISGLMLVNLVGYELDMFWIQGGLILYGFAGACWLPVVWMQIQMRNMAKTALETSSPLPSRFWIMDRGWIVLGSLAFPAILVVFYLMVYRPVEGFW